MGGRSAIFGRMENGPGKDFNKISAWLLAGVIMVFFQIILGGITRLTGSGLSITEWDIVTGTLPPLSMGQWVEEFNLYKATPQYKQINEGMSLAQFKFIYFWEYLHRLWARLMGFVFVIPFFYFLIRRSLSSLMLKRLGIVILLAALAAVFGWIMVKSGLKDVPWVNAYKLTIHLGLGISLFIYLLFTWLSCRGYERHSMNLQWRQYIKMLIGLIVVQLGLGGIVSGTKSAMNFPTWPLMSGSYIPEAIKDPEQWNAGNFLMYHQSLFIPALSQFLHRNLAYLLLVLVLVFVMGWMREAGKKFRWLGWAFVGIIVAQIALGILTLIHSIGRIPVFYGAFHQGLGILILALFIYAYQTVKPLKI